MTEVSGTALSTAGLTGTLSDYAVSAAAHDPQAALFSRKVDGAWQDVSAGQFLAEVGDLARGFVAWGLEAGDRVGLMSATRYEWTLVDFAVWMAGGVPVPIYETSSAEQVEWILQDSGAVGCVVETGAHLATLRQVDGGLPALRSSWTMADGDLDRLVDRGAEVPADAVDARRRAVAPDDLATIIYTSGTTGRPKGCELTHAMLRAEVDNTATVLTDVFSGAGGSTLLFLPLAHVFARLIELGCVATRTRMGHTSDVKNLLEDLAVFQPTFILSVPRVLEKIYNTSEHKAQAAGKGRIFHAAARTAVAWSEGQNGGGTDPLLRLRHAVFDRLVYSRLRTALGGRISFAVSGGAPLGARLGHFYRGAGIPVLEGYGLTETSAASTVNTPGHVKIGSVGRAIPGCTLRIADDGEVLISGAHVFRGYRGDEAATAEAVQGGWFHSGDLGTLDDEGFLTITGRKKEIIVTAGGKNVAPAVLEDRLRAHALISHCMVVGDGRPFIGALITLDADALPGWLAARGKRTLAPGDVASDPDVLAEVQLAVNDANKAVSAAEAIKRFRILPHDFTEDGGHLTPTLKLKRAVVQSELAADISALYG